MTSKIALIGPRGNTISVTAAGSGPALFLLHGFPLDHRLWQPQLQTLSQYYHVVAPELRGFGGSTLTEATWSLRDLAEDVEFVRQHLAANQTIHLCGLSMGGYVAFEYWHAYRDHLKSLTLLNTKPNADDEAGRTARFAMAQKAVEQGTWPAVEPMLAKVLSPSTFEHKPTVVEVVKSMMSSTAPQTIAAAQNAMANRRDFTPLLSTMRLPVCVVTGSDDPIAPPEATAAWAAMIPDARCISIAAAAHLTPLEQPDEINQLLMQL